MAAKEDRHLGVLRTGSAIQGMPSVSQAVAARATPFSQLYERETMHDKVVSDVCGDVVRVPRGIIA
jgi:hypothetical protein